MRRDDGSVRRRVEESALRNHGDRERVDRVWERLEPKLTLGPTGRLGRGRAGSRSRMIAPSGLLTLGAAAGFLLGVGVAGWLWQGDGQVKVEEVGREGIAPAPAQVFAAGSQARSVALPGGGTVMLEPGATVEEATDGLRLVQGEATFAAPAGASLELTIGHARVRVSPGAQVQVRRDGSYAFLQALNGSVEVTPPDALGQSEVLGPNDRKRVRITTATALVPTPDRTPVEEEHAALPDSPEKDDAYEDEELVEPLAAPEPWVQACKEGDDEQTVKLLEQSPGAAAKITDPALLQCIARGHQLLGNENAQVATLQQLLNDPDRQLSAAYALKKIFEKRARTSKSPQDQALAAHYADQHRKFQLAALAREKNLEAFESEQGLCNRIVAEASINNSKAVRSLSAQYKDAYPDGPCIGTIDGLLAKLPPEPEPDAPEPEPYPGE